MLSSHFSITETSWINNLQNILLSKALLRSCKLRVMASFKESIDLTFFLPSFLLPFTFPTFIVLFSGSCFLIVWAKYDSFNLAILASRESSARKHNGIRKKKCSLNHSYRKLQYPEMDSSSKHRTFRRTRGHGVAFVSKWIAKQTELVPELSCDIISKSAGHLINCFMTKTINTMICRHFHSSWELMVHLRQQKLEEELTRISWVSWNQIISHTFI